MAVPETCPGDLPFRTNPPSGKMNDRDPPTKDIAIADRMTVNAGFNSNQPVPAGCTVCSLEILLFLSMFNWRQQTWPEASFLPTRSVQTVETKRVRVLVLMFFSCFSCFSQLLHNTIAWLFAAQQCFSTALTSQNCTENSTPYELLMRAHTLV